MTPMSHFCVFAGNSMYKLAVSELAHEDLRSIIKYINDELSAPGAASAFADEVEQCYTRIKNNPLVYSVCSDERLAKEGYRRALVKNYILVYKVDEEKNVANIYRFFYGAEDYLNKI